jgi:hypothetical protein
LDSCNKKLGLQIGRESESLELRIVIWSGRESSFVI